jgi:hypothetical protein
MLADDMWRGKPAFVLGGGPSIVEEHYESLPQLHDHGLVIATNRAIELPIRPDIWVWLEERVYRWMGDGTLGSDAKAAFDSYSGLRVTRRYVGRVVQYPSNVIVLETDPKGHLGDSLAGVVNRGCNTGFFGLNLAWLLGANPIILLGFDQNQTREDGRIPHWHDDYPHDEKSQAEPAFNVMRSDFEHAAAEARRVDRTIWNASSQSALTCFPRFESLESMFTVLGGVA